MNNIRTNKKQNSGRLFITILMIFMFCLATGTGFITGQDISDKTGADKPKQRITEVGFRVVSAEITRFKKPFHFVVGKQELIYKEAMVFKIKVDKLQFDSLPPDIEPFLYIGKNEYHIFNIDRNDENPDLVLTFHIRNWEKLEEGVPMVLTIAHGEPVLNPKFYYQGNFPMYRKSLVKDKR